MSFPYKKSISSPSANLLIPSSKIPQFCPLPTTAHTQWCHPGQCQHRCSLHYLTGVLASALALLRFALIAEMNLKKNFFFNFFFTMLSLHCCTWAFSSCTEQGLLSSCDTCASHCPGFLSQSVGSVVVVHGLSCPVARAILPDQESNLCALHWQADS